MASSSTSSPPKHPYPSSYSTTISVSDFVSIKLSKDNYPIWKTQMNCLLVSQDLVGFIDGSISQPVPSELTNQDYLIWRRSDHLLKGWILGSLSDEVLASVFHLETARDIWEKLQQKFDPHHSPDEVAENREQTLDPHHSPDESADIVAETQEQTLDPHHSPDESADIVAETREKTLDPHHSPDEYADIVAETRENDFVRYLPLYKATLAGDWETANSLFVKDRSLVSASITKFSETALHIAIGTGIQAIDFVEKIVQLMTEEELALPWEDGCTALTTAAIVGNTDAAIILIKRNPNLLRIKSDNDRLPHHDAAICANKDTLSYLLRVTKDEEMPTLFAGKSGTRLLSYIIDAGMIGMALDLVQRYPHFTTLMPQQDDSPLAAIAKQTIAFPSGSRFNFWESLIYSCVSVKLENYYNKTNGGDVENPDDSSQVLRWICEMVPNTWRNYFNSVQHIKHIRETKTRHYQAHELVKHLCKEIMSSNDQNVEKFREAIEAAARMGVHEIVEEIVDAYPHAIWLKGENDNYIFHIAVINRSEKVFNLLYQMSGHKRFITGSTNNDKNNILHLAGKLAPQHKLNLVSGAALQMQRELQWFKEVEKFVTSEEREDLNSSEKTPAMVFSEEHKDLMIEGGKWMKDTASSCSIAAALIATVVFAAAFTVPGGTNGDSGFPILSKNRIFTTFIVSDVVSLFSSTTSLLIFLSILTARYAEGDFLYVLPKRLILGLVTLFLSITSMIITFSATLYLVFGQQKAWSIIPMVALACLPVTSFVRLQFPLLVTLISSTYGRSIFGKQSDRPFH